MIVELHALQNFAPSNLNRDDTGSPKDCEFGGYRRARVSSQCFKRAIREHFKSENLVPESALAVRTKRLAEELISRLVERGKPAEEARAVVTALLAGAKLSLDKDGKTQYLLFLGRGEIDRFAGICLDYWSDLSTAAAPAGDAPAQRNARDAKKAGKEAVPEAARAALAGALGGGKAVDLALFGRMIADAPERNVDAACQVAHAISTHKVSVEFDFYTAVDDLKPGDTTGADMLGTVEFNSACFYRYANLDLVQLRRNLDGDDELARQALAAFLRAFVHAVPTGKQNSTAAQNPPSFVFAVAREHGLWSLANAFARPVRPSGDAALVEKSIAALDKHWGDLTRMYGANGIVGRWVCALDDAELVHLKPDIVGSFEDLVTGALTAAG